jgi:glycosyltransferase involved in cell wall biosynthesis
LTNILFIAFEFPPLSRGGVHRPLAFVKYLPVFGVRPIVITLDKNSFPHVYDSYGYDETLGKEILENTRLIPVQSDKPPRSSRLGQFMSIYFTIHGNETKYWKKGFREAVDSAVKNYNPEIIFATVPPFSVLPLVGEAAKKHKLPLILDFRDAWSQWRTIPYGTIVHYWKTLAMEKKWLSGADAIIATSEQTLNDFKKLHSEIPASNWHYIPNGFDGCLKNWQAIDTGKPVFTIGYVGSFYYSPEARKQMLQPWWKKKGHRMLQFIPYKQDWLYRSPYFFFKALQQLNKSNPNLARRIRVRFAGKVQDWLKDMIDSFELGEQVELMGEISHTQSLSFQSECDALLITSAKQIGGKDYSIAGKTFEYLQMQKPIIAFVCEGAQKEVLKKAGTALICNPDNTDQSVENITDLLEGRISLTPDPEFLKGLSREKLTEQLANVIKRYVKKS